MFVPIAVLPESANFDELSNIRKLLVSWLTSLKKMNDPFWFFAFGFRSPGADVCLQNYRDEEITC